MSETQTTHKPLPCPFCGGEKIAIAEGSTYRWAHAECGECGAAAGDIRRQYGQGTDTPEVQEAAIAEWNTRDRREIDGLRDELAVILRERNDAHLALAAARAHNAELSTELAGANFEGNLAMIQRDEARAEVARLTPLSEIHDAWRKLHGGKESPSEESVVRFIEFAHAAAGRAYEADK